MAAGGQGWRLVFGICFLVLTLLVGCASAVLYLVKRNQNLFRAQSDALVLMVIIACLTAVWPAFFDIYPNDEIPCWFSYVFPAVGCTIAATPSILQGIRLLLLWQYEDLKKLPENHVSFIQKNQSSSITPQNQPLINNNNKSSKKTKNTRIMVDAFSLEMSNIRNDPYSLSKIRRPRKWFSDSYLLLFWVLHVTLLPLLFSPVFILTGQYFSTRTNCMVGPLFSYSSIGDVDSVDWVWLGGILYYLPWVLFLIYKLRQRGSDGLGISKQLIWQLLYFCSSFTTYHVVRLALRDQFNVDFNFFYLYTIPPLCVPIHILLLPYVLSVCKTRCKCRRRGMKTITRIAAPSNTAAVHVTNVPMEESSHPDSSSSFDMTLDSVMNDERGVAFLLKYCATEFTTEIVYCLRALSQYRLNPSHSSMKQITRVFLQEGSPLEVNISAQQRRFLSESIDNIENYILTHSVDDSPPMPTVMEFKHRLQHIFDNIDKEIRSLFIVNTWPRFLRSNLCSSYMNGGELNGGVDNVILHQLQQEASHYHHARTSSVLEDVNTMIKNPTPRIQKNNNNNNNNNNNHNNNNNNNNNNYNNFNHDSILQPAIKTRDTPAVPQSPQSVRIEMNILPDASLSSYSNDEYKQDRRIASQLSVINVLPEVMISSTRRNEVTLNDRTNTATVTATLLSGPNTKNNTPLSSARSKPRSRNKVSPDPADMLLRAKVKALPSTSALITGGFTIPMPIPTDDDDRKQTSGDGAQHHKNHSYRNLPQHSSLPPLLQLTADVILSSSSVAELATTPPIGSTPPLGSTPSFANLNHSPLNRHSSAPLLIQDRSSDDAADALISSPKHKSSIDECLGSYSPSYS